MGGLCLDGREVELLAEHGALPCSCLAASLSQRALGLRHGFLSPLVRCLLHRLRAERSCSHRRLLARFGLGSRARSLPSTLALLLLQRVRLLLVKECSTVGAFALRHHRFLFSVSGQPGCGSLLRLLR